MLHKLQAVKAKMGSAAEGGFTPLSKLGIPQLDPWNHRGHRVRVRISRIWKPRDPNTNEVFGLDSLLIDEEGETMQAHVYPNHISLFEHRLVEGKVYTLSNFTVRVSQGKYMACSKHFTLYFNAQTLVAEVGNICSIPLHKFWFVDFGAIPSRSGKKTLLTDVMGQITYVGDIKTAKKGLLCISFRNLKIQDLSGRVQDVTLYGDLGRHFDVKAVVRKDQEAPVVVVFAGMLVDRYPTKFSEVGGFLVRTSSASKCYLDLEILEVQEFRDKLPGAHIPIDQCDLPFHQDPTQVSFQITDRIQELLESCRTIEELNNLDPDEWDENAKFLCRASIINIDCTGGWCYVACCLCRRRMSGDGSNFWCSECAQLTKEDIAPVLRYKLDVVVRDVATDATTNFMIFDDQAKKLVGVEAEDLIEEDTTDVDSKYTLPDAISRLFSSIHVFQVAVKNWNFDVKWILKDVEVALLEAHGLKRPKVEAPLKTVIKEETELDINDEAEDAEAE